VDTDQIAHELTSAGGAAIGGVRDLFGHEYIDTHGAMDRRKMRERVFADPAARQRLEALLHPLIREESRRRVAEAKGPYVVHVVPLLVESPDYRRRVDRVLVVDCPEQVQLARVRERSGLAEDEVRRIIAAQATRAMRQAAADDVIDNGGSLDDLFAQVQALHRRYLQLAGAGR